MSEITIKKAALKEIKGGYGLNVTYFESQDGAKPKKHILEDPQLVHPDLVSAMNGLSAHFAICTGYMATGDIDPAKFSRKQMEDYHIHGYTLSDDENDPWVIISGHRDLAGSSPVNLHTPLTRLKTEGEKAYAHVVNLNLRLDKLEKEVIAYIQGEKVGKDPQGDLFEQQPPAHGEINSGGKGMTEGIPPADAGAQKRVAGGGKSKKKVKQTAEHPSGEKEEGGDE